jgi:predicted acylesterase/phospholipase RssA
VTPGAQRQKTTPLRLWLTLSCGASLGAYEAGAAAGLAIAVRRLDSDEGAEASIDAIGGASAGALVGLFAAHSLLEGLDPVRTLHEAWVERVSLQLLRDPGPNALLSFEELRERLPEVLDPDEPADPADGLALRQRRPIAFHVALTGLRGLTYPIRGLRDDRPVAGATYADWGRFDLEPGGGIEQIAEPAGRSPLDFVLASAASPGGFAPRLLDRRPDEEGYRSRGIDNFPDSGHLWYTDGGLLASQPLGRVIAAARQLHGPEPEARAVHLLIDPRSEAPTGSEQWSDPEQEPTWQEGLSRALAILSEQSLFDDMRRLEKDNSRIDWAERLSEALAPHLGDGAEPALREFLESVGGERRRMRADEPARERDRRDAEEASDRVALLRQALAEVGGLTGKGRVAIDSISPLILGGDDGDGDVESLLAGEFLGDFGGFLNRDLRESDFALGYESALEWLRQALPTLGVDDDAVTAAVEAVEARRPTDHEQVGRGRASLGDLSLADRWQLVRLGLHAARVLGSGAIDLRSRIPDPLGRAIRGARRRLPVARD